MARKEIKNPMDDNSLNNTNHNFTELYSGFRDTSGKINKVEKDINDRMDNFIDETSDAAFDKVVDSARLNWDTMVEKYSDLPSDAKKGTTIGVKEDSLVYRYDGSKWVDIYEINLNPISEVDDRLSSQLAQTINIRNFGGAVNTDITQAFKDALGQAALLESDITIPSGVYYISGSLGVVNHPIKIRGDNVKLVLTQDISHLIRFMEQTTLEGIEIDFGGNACLDGYGLYFHFKPTIVRCGFKNLHGISSTQNQYVLEISNDSERVVIDNSVFYNVTNIGDGLSTNYGFTGFIFFRGVIPSGKKTIVNVVNNEFDKTKTIFPTGLSEQEKQNDQDADAIRAYGSDSVNHNKEQLEFHFKGNRYSKCQKRFYKINHARVFIDNDIGDNRENDSLENPSAHSFGQFRGCEVAIKNSDYVGRIRAEGFNLMESTEIRIIQGHFVNTEPNNKTRLIGNNAPLPRPSVIVRDVEYDGFTTFTNHTSSGVIEKIDVEGLTAHNSKVLLRIDGEITNLRLKDIKFYATVPSGDNNTRTLEYHNVTSLVEIDNVEIIETVRRGGTYPHAIIIGSPTFADKLVLRGDVSGSMSRVNIRSNDVVITNSYSKGFVYEITDGTGCYLINTVYESYSSVDNLQTFGNTQVAPWHNS